jgi:hypothetical protein
MSYDSRSTTINQIETLLVQTLINPCNKFTTMVPELGLWFVYARAKVALGSLSCCHRRSSFLVLQKGESEDGSVKSKEHNHNPNPRVRDLPHHWRTGSTLVMDVEDREEEAGPPGRRLTTIAGRGSAPPRR